MKCIHWNWRKSGFYRTKNGGKMGLWKNQIFDPVTRCSMGKPIFPRCLYHGYSTVAVTGLAIFLSNYITFHRKLSDFFYLYNYTLRFFLQKFTPFRKKWIENSINFLTNIFIIKRYYYILCNDFELLNTISISNEIFRDVFIR